MSKYESANEVHTQIKHSLIIFFFFFSRKEFFFSTVNGRTPSPS